MNIQKRMAGYCPVDCGMDTILLSLPAQVGDLSKSIQAHGDRLCVGAYIGEAENRHKGKPTGAPKASGRLSFR